MNSGVPFSYGQTVNPTFRTPTSARKDGDEQIPKSNRKAGDDQSMRKYVAFQSIQEDLKRDTSYVRAAANILYDMDLGPKELLLLQRFQGWKHLANGRASTDRTLLTDAVYVLFNVSANHTLQPIEEVYLFHYHLLSSLGSEACELLDAVGLKVSLL